MKRLLLAVLVLGVACFRPQPPPPLPPPSPSPVPTPVPTPTPIPAPAEPELSPLRVEGSKFFNALGHVVARGSGGVCCGGSGIGFDLGKFLGWPWMTREAIDQFAQGGSNCDIAHPCFLHFRAGPTTTEAEGEGFALYARVLPNGVTAPRSTRPGRWPNSYPKPVQISVGPLLTEGKYDLERWDEANVKSLHDRVRYANDHGFYVEVVAGLDGWTADHCQEWDYLCPWQRQNNVQGFDACSLSTLERPVPPGGYAERYTRKLVSELGRLRVLWLVSNEGFKAGYSEAYYTDFIRIIRDEEEKLGQRIARPAIHHPIGVNQQERGPLAQAELLADYAERHQGQRWNSFKPAGVNEYPEQGLSNPEQKPPSSAFRDQQALAYNAGGFFLLWYGEWRLEEYRRGISFVGDLANAP